MSRIYLQLRTKGQQEGAIALIISEGTYTGACIINFVMICRASEVFYQSIIIPQNNIERSLQDTLFFRPCLPLPFNGNTKHNRSLMNSH